MEQENYTNQERNNQPIIIKRERPASNAVYKSQGSTINDSGLVNAALNAACKAQFSAVSGEEMQTGTITYNFKLN